MINAFSWISVKKNKTQTLQSVTFKRRHI